MKQIFLIFFLALTFSCKNSNGGGDAQSHHENGNVNEYSGENISPQLENQSDTTYSVDTVSGPSSVQEEKKQDLH